MPIISFSKEIEMSEETSTNGVNGDMNGGHARSRMGVAIDALSPRALRKTVTQIWGNVSHKAAGAWCSVAGTFSPCADVVEEANQFVVTMEVPGMSADCLDISFMNGILTVKGEKDVARTGREVRLKERSDGKFERGIDIGYPIDCGCLDADLANGVLTVRLKKMVAPQTEETKIRIKP